MDIVALIKPYLEVFDVIGTVGTIVSALLFIWSAVAGFFLFRARARAHKYSRVYFPKDSEDFYQYYVGCISKAKKAVFITSDGFNMRNSRSRASAEKMNDAQMKAIKNGAEVNRYQMLETMHINWVTVICELNSTFPEKYKTYYNRKFESVGSFCVIDPGTRKTVFEFMLPDVGDFGQSTQARDYGFVHGHQHKSDMAVNAFKKIFDDPDTVQITHANGAELMEQLWNERMDEFLKNPNFRLFDEELIEALTQSGGKRVPFDLGYFKGATH